MFNSLLCPYCFRPLGTWQKDPILLPNGCPNEWVSATETTLQTDITKRIYKGTCQICEAEIQEIQDFLKQTEIDNSISPLTVWSSLNTSGKFQITGKHIKEMRDSIEKLLTEFGLTKTDYFNYDEEGNEIIQPNGQKLDWTDPITTATDLKKFQVKYIHIEDLRHYMQTFWQETWAKVTGSFSETISFDEINRVDSFTTIVTLQADKIWKNLTGTAQFLYFVGQESRLHGNGTCNYQVSPGGVYFDGSISDIGVDNSQLDVEGTFNASSDLFLSTNLSIGYNKDLRLELIPFNLTGSASQGTDVILIPYYTKGGIIHDTAAELTTKKLLTEAGGYVAVRLKFSFAYPYSSVYIYYYKFFGQNVLPTGYSIEWIPDSNNGRYLFDDLHWLFPTLTNSQFSHWVLTDIQLAYRGIISTTRIVDIGVAIYGYSDLVGLSMNYDIGTIAARIRARP